MNLNQKLKFRNELEKVMKERGHSASQVAEISGISRTSISRFIRGEALLLESSIKQIMDKYITRQSLVLVHPAQRLSEAREALLHSVKMIDEVIARVHDLDELRSVGE